MLLFWYFLCNLFVAYLFLHSFLHLSFFFCAPSLWHGKTWTAVLKSLIKSCFIFSSSVMWLQYTFIVHCRSNLQHLLPCLRSAWIKMRSTGVYEPNSMLNVSALSTLKSLFMARVGRGVVTTVDTYPPTLFSLWSNLISVLGLVLTPWPQRSPDAGNTANGTH